MSMVRIRERRKEERQLLLEICLEGAVTDDEKILGYRDFKLIENGLDIMRMKSLLVTGSKGTGRKAMSDIFNTMLDVEIKERYELGLMPMVPVKFSEISSVDYTYYFTHTVKTKQGSQKRGYKTEVSASTDASALAQLESSLRKRGLSLVSVDKQRRRLSYISTKDGRWLPKYQVELIDDSEE